VSPTGELLDRRRASGARSADNGYDHGESCVPIIVWSTHQRHRVPGWIG
jgi:hypothetical protein